MKKLLILIVLISFFSCKRRAITEIHYDVSIKRFPNYNYSDKIDSVKYFTNVLIDEYRKIIYSKVNFRFIDSFDYTNLSQIELDLFLSNTRELYFEINHKKNPRSVVKATDLPIQLAMMGGYDIFGDALRDYPNFKIKNYDADSAHINWGNNQFVTLTDLTFKGGSKMFNFMDDSELVLLRGGTIYRQNNNYQFANISFISSSPDFSGFVKYAKGYASDIANFEMLNIYFGSNYFRKILASDSLGTFAKNMLVKYERSKRSGNYSYLDADFDKDRTELKVKVKLYGVDSLYADDILKDEKDRINPGTLFWFYYDYFGFSIQWVIANLAILIVMIPIIIFRNRSVINRILIQIVPVALILSISKWIFSSRPPDMPIQYWILPGILMLTACILAMWFFPKKKAP